MALVLDGTYCGQWRDIEAIPVHLADFGFTISCRAKCTAYPTATPSGKIGDRWACIWAFGNNADTDADHWKVATFEDINKKINIFGIAIDADGLLGLLIRGAGTGAGGLTFVSTGKTMVLGTWHSIIVSGEYPATTTTGEEDGHYYVKFDGDADVEIQIADGTIGGIWMNNGLQSFAVGGYHATAATTNWLVLKGFYFTGEVAELDMIEEELDASTRTAIYNGGRPIMGYMSRFGRPGQPKANGSEYNIGSWPLEADARDYSGWTHAVTNVTDNGSVPAGNTTTNNRLSFAFDNDTPVFSSHAALHAIPSGSTTIAIVGDPQIGNSLRSEGTLSEKIAASAAEYEALIATLNAYNFNAIVEVGDLVDLPLDSAQLAAYDASAATYRATPYRVGGNHDFQSSAAMATWSGLYGNLNYTVDLPNDVRLICINSMPLWAKTDATLTDAFTNAECATVLNYLRTQAIQAVADNRVTFLVMHHPPHILDEDTDDDTSPDWHLSNGNISGKGVDVADVTGSVDDGGGKIAMRATVLKFCRDYLIEEIACGHTHQGQWINAPDAGGDVHIHCTASTSHCFDTTRYAKAYSVVIVEPTGIIHKRIYETESGMLPVGVPAARSAYHLTPGMGLGMGIN